MEKATIQLFKSKSQQMRWKRNQDMMPTFFHRIWKMMLYYLDLKILTLVRNVKPVCIRKFRNNHAYQCVGHTVIHYRNTLQLIYVII